MVEWASFIAGVSLAVAAVTIAWPRIAESLLFRILAPMRTIPWALHSEDSFIAFLGVSTPSALQIRPRGAARLLSRIKGAQATQVALYTSPPRDLETAAQFLHRSRLLGEVAETKAAVLDALASVDVSAKQFGHHNGPAQYHPVASPGGDFQLMSEIDAAYGALVAWPKAFPFRWPHHAEFVAHITTSGIAVVCVDDDIWQRCVDIYLSTRGVSLDRVVYLRARTDDVWMRDYGPSFIRSADSQVAVVSNPYWPSEGPIQKADDQFSIEFARRIGIPSFRLPLIVEGGNLVTDGQGMILICDSVLKRNPEISECQLQSLMEMYFGCSDFVLLPSLPGEVTGHADMIVKFLDHETIAVASSPAGTRWSGIFDEIASLLERRKGHQSRRVVRLPCVPTRDLDPRAWGYVNALTVNDSIILPRFGVTEDAVAEKILSRVLPNAQLASVDMSDYPVGAVHCQAKELPQIAEFGDSR